MKRHQLALLLGVAFVTGEAAGAESSMYDRFKNPVSAESQSKGIPGVRRDMISEAAYATGLRAGAAQRAGELLSDLKTREVEYDRAFRFSVIETESGIFVPPVIDEINDSMSGNGETLRITKTIYRIIKRGRLQAQPPTWRDYLYTGLNTKEPARPDDAVLPRSPDEKAIWDTQFDRGWKDGIAETEAIYQKNMARLTRDYLGMRRYTALRDQGVMTTEMVVETNVAVRENSPDDMSVNETTYRLKTQPRFNTNSTKWKPGDGGNQ